MEILTPVRSQQIAFFSLYFTPVATYREDEPVKDESEPQFLP